MVFGWTYSSSPALPSSQPKPLAARTAQTVRQACQQSESGRAVRMRRPTDSARRQCVSGAAPLLTTERSRCVKHLHRGDSRVFSAALRGDMCADSDGTGAPGCSSAIPRLHEIGDAHARVAAAHVAARRVCARTTLEPCSHPRRAGCILRQDCTGRTGQAASANAESLSA